MPDSVKTTVVCIEVTGLQQFYSFMQRQLNTDEVSPYDTIKKDNLPTFSKHCASPPLKNMKTLLLVKQNCAFFAQLYVSCQGQQGNLDEFIANENQSAPNSASLDGMIRTGTKSDLVKILEKDCTSNLSSDVDTLAVDGVVMVHLIKPHAASTTFL